MELAYRERRLGEENVFARTWLPLLEQGGVGLQVCPVYVDVTVQPEGSLREALSLVASFHRAVSENGDRVVQVETAADLERVESGERIGLMLSLEGVECFGVEIWPADVFHTLGVRMAGPDVEPAERVCRRGRGGRRRPLAARPRARRPARGARDRPRPRARVVGRLRGAPRARSGRADPLLPRRLPRRARHAAEPRRRPAPRARRRGRSLRPHAAPARDRPTGAHHRSGDRPSRARSLPARRGAALPRRRLHAAPVGGDATAARAEGRADARRARAGRRDSTASSARRTTRTCSKGSSGAGGRRRTSSP